MKLKKSKFLISSLILLFLILIIILFIQKQKSIIAKKTLLNRPNILLISLCSVRFSELMAYGATFDAAPSINKFSKSAYVFKNAVGQTSWRNFWVGWFTPLLWHPERANGFQAYSAFKDISSAPRSYELAGTSRNIFKYLEVQESTKEKLLESLRPYKEKMLSHNQLPFFFNLLIKSVHFPYSGINREQINYSEFMPDSNFKLYKSYLNQNLDVNFLIPEDKIAFFALLFGNRSQIENSLAKLIPQNSIPKDPLGIMNNDSFLTKWKKSKSYSMDLDILKGAYRAKLQFVDSEIKDFINLFDNDELKENTIVIIAGDHGTALMEHGNLHNGNTPYEEVIKTPLFIHFPEMKEMKNINLQFSEKSLQKIVTSLLNGSLTSKNFDSILPSLEENDIFSRDCPQRNFSIRENNKWKYFWDISSRERKLYDLQNDPNELNDLSETKPEVITKFEELILENQKRLRVLNNYGCPTESFKYINAPPEEE